MPHIKLNEVNLYYEISGSADSEPVVLVHGSWGDSGGWDNVFSILSQKFRVLKYDRRGHSRSERPEGQGSTDQDVEDLQLLIEYHDLGAVNLVGNSFGGNIALKLAGKRPDLIKSLLVHEPAVISLLKDHAPAEMLNTLQQKISVVTDLIENGEFEEGAELFIENIVFGPGSWEELPQESRDKFVYNAPTFLDEQRDPQWMDIDIKSLSTFYEPVLLTYGEESEEFFRIIIDELEKILPNCRKQSLSDMGHVPQLTHPQMYSELLTSFLLEKT